MSQPSIIKKIHSANRNMKLACAIIFIVIAIVIALGLLPEHTKYYLARENVFAKPVNEHRVDKFYRGKTYSLYDWFAENSDGRFYLAPAVDKDGNDAYIVVYIPNKYTDKAETLIRQTQDYLATGDDSVLKESISCNGYIDEVNSKTQMYLTQYLDLLEAPASMRNQVSTKMFVMVPLSKVILSEGSLYMVLVIAFLIGAVYMLATCFSKKHLKKIDTRLARESITSSDLDAEFTTPLMQFGSTYVSDKHVITVAIAPQILTIADVVWTYPNKVDNVNSKPVYQAVFFTRYHECLRFILKDETQTESLCRIVHEKQPRALYGYVIENSDMYYHHFNELLDQVYNQGNGQAAAPETPEAVESSAVAAAETNKEDQV